MNSKLAKETLIGFLTIVEPHGGLLIGGYLILNGKGRPIEFHCTAPVQPNRAQQILYGASLRPYLCGERIGQALVSQAKRKPELVCTDILDVMGLREHMKTPLVWVPSGEETDQKEFPSDYCALTVDPETGSSQSSSVWMFENDSEKRREVEAIGRRFTHVCWSEPFGRIHDAVREAQRDAAA